MHNIVAIVLLVSCFTIIASGANPSNWKQLNTVGQQPSPRSTMVAALFGNDIYAFGGVRENLDPANPQPNIFYNDVYRYRTTTKRWTKMNALPDTTHGFPDPRGFSIGGRNGNEMWIGFGFNYTADFSSLTTYNDLWAYNTNTNRWRLVLPNGNTAGPSGRADPTAKIHDGKIYLFGGIDNTFSTFEDTWVYNIATNTWTELTNPVHPSPRYGATFTLDEDFDRLWTYSGEKTVFGPDGISFDYPTPDVFWYLDLNSQTWVQVNPTASPSLRNNGNNAVWFEGLFIIFGGDIGNGSVCDNVDFQQNNLNETWVYNSHINSWYQVCPATRPLNFKRGTMVLVGDTIYMFGGFAFQTSTQPCGPFVWNQNVWEYKIKGCFGGPTCDELSPGL